MTTGHRIKSPGMQHIPLNWILCLTRQKWQLLWGKCEVWWQDGGSVRYVGFVVRACAAGGGLTCVFNSKRSETINMQKRPLKSGFRECTQTTEVNGIYTLMSSQTATAVYWTCLDMTIDTFVLSLLLCLFVESFLFFHLGIIQQSGHDVLKNTRLL